MTINNKNTLSLRKKIGTTLITVLFLAGLIALALSNRIIAASNQSSTPIDNNHYVASTPIQLQNSYRVKKHYIGTVRPQQSSQLSFQSMGAIQQIFVNAGDRITQGQVLAQLNTEDLAAKRLELQAKLSLADIKLTLAKKNYARVATAKAKKAYTEQQEDEALSALKMAETDIAITKAQLKQLSITINKATINAPYNGVVNTRFLDSGTIAQPNQTVLSVQNNNYEAVCGVTSNAVKHLSIGKEYHLNINGKKIPALLKSINNSQKSNELIELTFTIKNNPSLLRSGDIATLSITENNQRQGIWVDIENLNEAARGLWSIFIAEKTSQDNVYQVSPRTVEIIYANSQQAYITGSFKEGEKLITKGSKKLVPQQKVKIN